MFYPYLVLDVDEDASAEEIRQAYMKKVRAHPPEQDPEWFQAVCQAYGLVRDEVSRARLRLFGFDGHNPRPLLANLAPRTECPRRRIGHDAWIEANRTADGQQSASAAEE